MKEIKKFEEVIAAVERGEDVRQGDMNYHLYWAYRYSKDAGNEFIDFDEAIWDYDIEPIAEFLKAEGITEFTISSTFSSLIPTLAKFEEFGFKMAGLTTVKARYSDWQTGERAVIPAIRMSL